MVPFLKEFTMVTYMVPQERQRYSTVVAPPGILPDFSTDFINVKSLLLSLLEALSIHGTDLCFQE